MASNTYFQILAIEPTIVVSILKSILEVDIVLEEEEDNNITHQNEANPYEFSIIMFKGVVYNSIAQTLKTIKMKQLH